ncbi:MAG TPA: hypothetical protein VFO00_07160 [Vitreimonas sp.]|nr:hypothetical protein [Vitreimonas sp.]
MKKILLGAAAAIAIAAPSVASAETNAVIGAHYGNTDFDGFDFDSYGINGAFSHDMHGGVLQMDGRWNRLDIGSGAPDLGNSYGAIHYGMRNDSHSFAGFVGLSDFFSLSGTGVGVEGQMFLGNFNLNGSLGFATYDDALDATHVQIDGAYFFTPNLAVTALVGVTEVDFDSGGDTDFTTYGVGGEWRFDGSPFSLTGGYRNHDFDGGDADSWMIGFNVDLGTGSVQERTRSGPGFNGAEALFGAVGTLVP